jgi:dihydroorotate dehydrogenase
MSKLYNFSRPFLLKMDAERAHRLTLKALKTGLIPCSSIVKNKALQVNLWNRQFPNPVGMAAGFDKNAEVIYPVLKMGFGFIEIGGVTPHSQNGLPKPRIFRDIPNKAIINRMNFPNLGMDAIKENIAGFLERKPRPEGLVGIQIAKGENQEDAAKDFVTLIRNLGPMADYITFNISCPNTPGLRDLQSRDMLLSLSEKILNERAKSCGVNPPPVVVKLSPDLNDEQKQQLAEAVAESGLDGVILTNTSAQRPKHLNPKFAERPGGLSGAPIKDKATQTIHDFYRITNGKVPIIGLGGISSGDDAYDKIKAGASLVQLYTGLVYKGPDLIHDINVRLLQRLKEDGLKHISEATGLAHKSKTASKKKA